MKILHIKKGEILFLTNKKTKEDSYKILLLGFEDNKNEIKVGIFDYTQSSDPDMKTITLSFGKRQKVCNQQITINPLVSEFHGINFAISAPPLYLIENDFLRDRKRKYYGDKGNG